MLVRIHHFEQKLDIHSAPPRDLEPLRDPFELYDEACKEYYGESSDQPVPMTSHKWMSMMRSTVRKMMMTTTMVVVTVMMMRTTTMSSRFFHAAYSFWHLLTKGEC